jgi:hypothetical protein
MRRLWLFFLPSLFFGSIASDLNVGLRALQQIRTLIPERLVDEEFSIIVDKKAFGEAFKAMDAHTLSEPKFSAIKAVGCSRFYYTHWTISGEPVRILDLYQEFEYGPYWLYPTAVQRLYDMHRGTKPDSSK